MNLPNLVEIKELVNEQEFGPAVRALVALEQRGEASAESQYLLGTVYHRLNRLGQAVDAFKKSLLMDPDFTDSAISLSVIYNDTGHYDEARKIFEKAEKTAKANAGHSSNSVVLDRAIAQKHLELGDLYKRIQRFDAAANEYMKAARLDPKNLEARVNLAKTLAQRGQTKLAKIELEKLVQEYPTHTAARVNLALLLYSIGNVIDARIELQTARVHAPDNELIKTYLALTESATESTVSSDELRDSL